MNGRRIKGLVGSVAAHGLLLAWVVGRAPPEPDPTELLETVAVEVLEVTPPRPGPLSTQAEIPGDPGQRPTVLVPDEPERDEPPPPPPPPPTRAQTPPEPTPRPSPPSTEPSPEPQAEPAEAGAGAEVSTPAEPEEGVGDEAPSATPANGREGGIESSFAGEGSSHEAGGLAGDGKLDHSAYGAEIVRLVLEEIDGDPVPGIPDGHAIQIELRLLPSGRLAARGLGRFDFAKVLRSTLGPVRTRWVLRRVQRASRRFPPHPDGFSNKVYEMDFTVRFKGNRAG